MTTTDHGQPPTDQEEASAAYRPRLDEACLVTFQGTLSADRAHGVYFAITAPGEFGRIAVPASALVRAEPLPAAPLPTEPGSMILANLAGADRPDLLVLRPVTSHESGEVTRWPEGSLVWESNSNGWIDPHGIARGWVQIDPTTLHPTGGDR